MTGAIAQGRQKKPKDAQQYPRPYATIDELRNNAYNCNIDPEKFYSVAEVFKKDLLCGLMKKDTIYRYYASDVTKGRFIKVYFFDKETRQALKLRSVSKNHFGEVSKAFVKGEDILKYLYNNLTPYVLYILEQRNRTRDLFLIKTGACNI